MFLQGFTLQFRASLVRLFGREAEVGVLKEMVGFSIEELKIFLGMLAHCLVLLLFVLLLNFLG